MALAWSMDKLGPIARSAVDAAYVFDAIRGRDPRDPSTRDASFTLPTQTSVEGWKVGIPKGSFDGPGGEPFQSVLSELEGLGVELVPIDLPEYPISAMTIILTAEAGAAFDDFTRAGKDDELVRQVRQAWPNVFRHAQLIPAVDYIRANRLRSQLIHDYTQALAGVRAICHPSFTGGILTATNLTGHPTFVAPSGFREDGTPRSISFTGKLDGESDLMTLASAWQRQTDYHKRHPKL